MRIEKDRWTKKKVAVLTVEECLEKMEKSSKFFLQETPKEDYDKICYELRLSLNHKLIEEYWQIRDNDKREWFIYTSYFCQLRSILYEAVLYADFANYKNVILDKRDVNETFEGMETISELLEFGKKWFANC